MHFVKGKLILITLKLLNYQFFKGLFGTGIYKGKEKKF